MSTSTIARRSVLAGGLGTLGSAVAAVCGAKSAQAALPIYMRNHSSSVANISITDTNPARSGHIFTVRPGYAGTGYGVYASASKLTQYWLNYPGSPVKTAKAGYWNYLPYSNYQYIIRVFN